MQHDNEKTTNFLVSLRNAQKVKEACNRILINRGVQEHGMKTLFPLHNNGLVSLQEDDKKEGEKAGEEMLCAILYLENSDKARFNEL